MQGGFAQRSLGFSVVVSTVVIVLLETSVVASVVVETGSRGGRVGTAGSGIHTPGGRNTILYLKKICETFLLSYIAKVPLHNYAFIYFSIQFCVDQCCFAQLRQVCSKQYVMVD